MNDKTYEQIEDEYSHKLSQNIAAGTAKAAFDGNQYDSESLDALPDGIADNSFGCGNPLAFAEVKVGDTVVDLGCGAGMDLLLAAQKTGPEGRVIGVDMTEQMLEKARSNIQQSQMQDYVSVKKGHIENLPIESDSVDFVISNCVVSLSPNKSQVFNEIHRVLKIGARMQITDLVVKDVPRWIHWLVSLVSPASAAGILNEDQYLSHVEQSGLVDVNVDDRFFYDYEIINDTIARELNVDGLTWFESFNSFKKKIVSCALLPFVSLVSRQLDNKVISLKISAKKYIILLS